MTDIALLRTVFGLLMIAAVFYLTICGGLFVWQRRIIFLNDTIRPDPALAGVPDVAVRSIRTSDGLDLVGWYQAPAAVDRPVVLFFHGNSGNIGHRAGRLAQLAASGWGVMMPEYRGFGGNPGTPSEEGLALDARAAYAALRAEGIPDDRIVIWGESLGTAVATRLAAEVPAAAVILEAPFTSMADIARTRYRFVPVDMLLKDRFDTLGRIGALTVPLLVMHGDHDGMIPLDMGRRVFDAATTPDRQFWTAENAGHNDLVEHGALDVAQRFVAPLLGVRHIARR
ncbi:MAG: alpha/beta hydrolase [Alphaproteobacteria bacterium]|nr:alpha/beta hydrolase [Alphaproteobacteria bacterium]